MGRPSVGGTRARAREDQNGGGLFADNPRKSKAIKFLLGIIRTPDDPPFTHVTASMVLRSSLPWPLFRGCIPAILLITPLLVE